VRVVGVVPAAGYARRLQPLQGSKEMVAVGGRPVMNHLLERLRLAPCDEIRVVTRPEKVDVRQHAQDEGAQVILARPGSVPASVAAASAGLPSSDVVLIGFPDTIWEPVVGFRSLVEAVEAGADVALGLFRSPEASRSDVVLLDSRGIVERVVPRPERPPSQLIWGCAAVRARALARVTDERELGDHFDRLCRTGAVAGVWLSDVFLDVGTPEALAAVRSTAAARS
jgi:NDP-sugar pyrophosphorylase family protein